MIAGTLEVQMLANLARLSDDMSKAKSMVSDAVGTIEKTLGALGIGFSASLLLGKINSVIEGMDKLKLSSEKTGATIEEMSKLQFFAAASGSNVDAVTSGLERLSKAMAAAGNAMAPASQGLKFLGLSAKDASGNLKDPAVLMQEIAVKLSAYEDGAGKAAIAMAIFGKSGAELLPTLKAMVELGGEDAAVTTEQANQAKAYTVELARLNQQKQILWNTVVSALLPSMESVVKVLMEASKQTGSLGSAAKGLAADGSITNWADASAMGVARFIDVVKTLAGMFDNILAPLQRYFLAAQAGFAAMVIMFGSATAGEKVQAMAALKAETDAQNEELKKRFANTTFWTAKINTETSDALAASMIAIDKPKYQRMLSRAMDDAESGVTVALRIGNHARVPS